MASKRLSLMMGHEQFEAQHDHNDDDQENEPPMAAKRFKTQGKASLESPMQRMLHRQIFSNSTNLSPITELSHSMRDTLLDGGGTPKSSTIRNYNSVSSSSYDSGNSLDDEYMAMFELETFDQMPLNKLPGDLDALISGQLKTDTNEEEVTPTVTTRSVRRCLSMTQQEPLDNTPLRPFNFRTKQVEKEVTSSTTPMRKSASMSNVDILNALGDEPALIGDLSKPCALPVLLSGVRHRDLKTISCDTLARLMRGDLANLSDCNYKIIDCRYPYEYEGGHIRGALNLYTRLQIRDAFPTTDVQSSENQRSIYVFHCEFSSERGPKLLRFLRNNDRSVHTHDYPTLSYPELYLLHNGYKEFFASFSDLCEPSNYVPMLAPAHNEEYRLCRAKTKSWQCGDSEGGDSGIGGAPDGGGSSTRSRHLSKSRSRKLYAE